MKTQIRNVNIYTEQGIISKGSLCFSGDKIISIDSSSIQDQDAIIIDGSDLSAIPGYIDSHCHGGGGYDCNQGSEESVIKMRDFYGKHGVTSLFPTLAADYIPELATGLDIIRSVMQQNTAGKTEIMGCHMEGPFLNKTYKGSQAEGCIIPMKDEHLLFYDKYKDVIKRTTIAPEVEHNVDYFPALNEMGIHVSVGHSCAIYSEVVNAMKKGAKSITHLYNAMSQTKKEGPFRIGGVLEAGLTQDDLYAEVICDGYHLPNELIQIAYRCKGVDKLSICSDANRAAGGKQGDVIHTCGVTFVIEHGVSMNEARTSLASSITPLDGMVRHLIFNVGLPAFDVVKMASGTTAKMMGIFNSKGSLTVGKDADINLVDKDFNIIKTFCKGIEVK